MARNVITCVTCGEVLESMHRHDYRTCGGPQYVMADGGHDYQRRGGRGSWTESDDGSGPVYPAAFDMIPAPAPPRLFGEDLED